MADVPETENCYKRGVEWTFDSYGYMGALKVCGGLGGSRPLQGVQEEAVSA